MEQLSGHVSEDTAFSGNGVKYWVETKSPSKQVLMRKALWDSDGRVILTAAVIVLILDGHIQARYLNEMSTEQEIEAFTRRYSLNPQQTKWCFTALEEIAPVEGVDHDY